MLTTEELQTARALCEAPQITEHLNDYGRLAWYEGAFGDVQDALSRALDTIEALRARLREAADEVDALRREVAARFDPADGEEHARAGLRVLANRLRAND